MSGRRNILAVGIAAAVVVAGIVLLKALPFGAAFFVTRSAVSFFNTPGEEHQMRAGFEEISQDWDGFLMAWGDSSGLTFRHWGARVAAQYVTEDELLEIYQFRASLFDQIASDPARNAACTGAFLADSSLSVSLFDVSPLMRLSGRGFARMHVGRQPWTPPIDLYADEAAWVAFLEYAATNGLQDVFDAIVVLLDGGSLDPEAMCLLNAQLYRAAADRPQDRAGAVRLIDFVRSIELLALTEDG